MTEAKALRVTLALSQSIRQNMLFCWGPEFLLGRALTSGGRSREIWTLYVLPRDSEEDKDPSRSYR